MRLHCAKMINIDDLQRELTQLTEEELQIENELSTYIQALVGDRTKGGSTSAGKKAIATTGGVTEYFVVKPTVYAQKYTRYTLQCCDVSNF